MYNANLNPGKLEIFTGPMCSGKTREMLYRVDRIGYVAKGGCLLVKPGYDKRNTGVKTRFGAVELGCETISEKNPKEILDLLNREHQVVAIDEAQFFDRSLIEVVEKLISRNLNVLVAGLDLNFRGEGFGVMPELMARADVITKLTAVCVYDNCGKEATRCQRLINGKPADYNSPVLFLGDTLEGYEPRCREHHIVPGKP